MNKVIREEVKKFSYKDLTVVKCSFSVEAIFPLFSILILHNKTGNFGIIDPSKCGHEIFRMIVSKLLQRCFCEIVR